MGLFFPSMGELYHPPCPQLKLRTTMQNSEVYKCFDLKSSSFALQVVDGVEWKRWQCLVSQPAIFMFISGDRWTASGQWETMGPILRVPAPEELGAQGPWLDTKPSRMEQNLNVIKISKCIETFPSVYLIFMEWKVCCFLLNLHENTLNFPGNLIRDRYRERPCGRLGALARTCIHGADCAHIFLLGIRTCVCSCKDYTLTGILGPCSGHPCLTPVANKLPTCWLWITG